MLLQPLAYHDANLRGTDLEQAGDLDACLIQTATNPVFARRER